MKFEKAFDTAGKLVLWIIWGSIMSALPFYKLYLGGGSNVDSLERPIDFFVTVMFLGPLAISTGIRWFLIPRLINPYVILLPFIIGVAFAESLAFYGIFLFPEFKSVFFYTGVLAAAQFIPFYSYAENIGNQVTQNNPPATEIEGRIETHTPCFRHTHILKRCGIILIAVGLADIVYMIWCITHQQSYSSSLNIFAIIAGIFLVKGSLKAASWIVRGISFLLSAGVSLIITMPFLYPFGYWAAALKSGGLNTALSLLITIAAFGILYWMRSELLRPEVLQAQDEKQVVRPKMLWPVGIGITIPIMLVILLGWMLHGNAAKEAIRRAELQLGGNYHYVVTSLQMHSAMKQMDIAAVVAVYNDHEFKVVNVAWQE